VTAGTLNCDGALTVVAEHSGQDTVIADIVRLVERAQVRWQLPGLPSHLVPLESSCA
jgi:cation transport ATPase